MERNRESDFEHTATAELSPDIYPDKAFGRESLERLKGLRSFSDLRTSYESSKQSYEELMEMVG